MKTQYLNPNWELIKKAYQSHDTSELYKELQELYRELNIISQSVRTKELKLLPVGTFVCYVRLNHPDLPHGEFYKKVKDGRKFMTVEYNSELWSIPYDLLRPVEKTTSPEAPGATISNPAIV